MPVTRSRFLRTLALVDAERDLLVTRDGLLLQHVLIERVHVDRPLKNTEKMLTRGMQPPALAEVILDNITSSEHILGVRVKENRPVPIGPHRGFKLVYAHRDKNGLRFRSVHWPPCHSAAAGRPETRATGAPRHAGVGRGLQSRRRGG